jgi:hypothetical protein
MGLVGRENIPGSTEIAPDGVGWARYHPARPRRYTRRSVT